MVMLRLTGALCLAALFILPARAQEGAQTAPPPPPPAFGAGAPVTPTPRPAPKKLPLFYLDLKDAPARAALVMIFQSAKTEFAIDNNVTGYLNLRTGNGTVEDFLTLAAKRHTDGLTWARESDVFIVKTKKKEPRTEPAPPLKYGSVADVPRRAAGIARGDQWIAILVTGEGTQADEKAKILRVGDKVPSGVPGVADLTVEKITAREVVLALPDGVFAGGEATLTVPVKRMPAEKE